MSHPLPSPGDPAPGVPPHTHPGDARAGTRLPAASHGLSARLPASLLPNNSALRWGADVGLALVLFMVLGLLFINKSSGSLLAMLAGWMMIASMALRRQAPLLMLGVVTTCSLCILGSSYHPIPAVLVIPLAVYSVARWVPGRWARLAVVSGVLGSVLAPLRWGHYFFGGYEQPTKAVQVLLVGGLCLALVITSYVIGRRVLQAAELAEQRQVTDAQRASHSIAEREQQLRIDEANVRAQIARELHDIVAHSLSVIIVQAEGGKALATKKPEAAAQVLGTIAESGREALAEMRRIVSVLRDGPAAQPDYSPMPGLDDIPDLVARSGASAHLDVVGEVPHVPQTLALTAYRVVQEALTNVLRHAGPEATAQVLLSYSPHLVVVEVVDNGRGAASSLASDGQGNGLRGMQERVASMGGQLVARPRSGGGFLVRALLPIVTGPGTPPADAPTGAPAVGPAAQPSSRPRPSAVAPPPASASAAVPATAMSPASAPVAAAPEPVVVPADPDTEPTQWVAPAEVTRVIPPPPEPTIALPEADPTTELPADRFDVTRPLPEASHPAYPPAASAHTALDPTPLDPTARSPR